MPRQKSVSELRAEAAKWPTVPELYAGRTLLITGGTGFMGKVLIEKLLYSCPDVAKIYVLLRPKRGKAEETRIAEMFKLPLFGRVRSERPNSAKKVVPIPGDLSAEGLAMSPEHREQLQRECSIVFHCGATLKLEAPLKDSILQNTCATASVIDLVKGMPKLISFVHLSTAFCHVDQLLLEEVTYDPLYEPEDLMRSVKWLKDEMLDDLEKKMLPPHPNTYTFSKRLAETLVERASAEIPACIVRPSIVVAAWKEPLEGWVDNLNGPVGLMVGAGKGVIRSMHCKAEYHGQVIPVDIAINGLIAAAWRRACDTSKEIQVYNVTQGRANPITWGEVLSKGRKYIYEYPFENAVWYPDGDMRSSIVVHELYAFFYHLLPALMIDGLLFIFGQKRFMMRIYKRIKDGLELLQYFATREWVFDNMNFENLKHQMKPEDDKVFFTDCTGVEHEPFLKNCVIGARQYCMREDLSTLPAARRHMNRLYWAQKIFNVLFYGFLIYFVLSFSETAMYYMNSANSAVKDSITSIPFARLLPGGSSASTASTT